LFGPPIKDGISDFVTYADGPDSNIYLYGSAKKHGSFKFSSYLDDGNGAGSELVTLSGTIEKNDEHQTIISFKEIDE